MEKSKKIVLLGQFGVGKTSVVRRFIHDTFGDDYKSTLGVEISKKNITLSSGKIMSMIIWDLEGFSKISKTRKSYLVGSKGFIYVFDATRPVTYASLAEEILYISEHYPAVDLLVVGNKKDAIDDTTLKNIQKKYPELIHSFVSAKTGDGVSQLFTDLAQKIST